MKLISALDQLLYMLVGLSFLSLEKDMDQFTEYQGSSTVLAFIDRL